MEEIKINKHSFQEALDKINKDIAKRPTVAILPTYQEKAFYFFDKSLTTKDMNSFVVELQNKILDTNSAIEISLNEIKSIYEALDTLDKDYIDGIVAALNKANEAIDDVKKNSEENTKTIGALNKTVDELLRLKDAITQLKKQIGDADLQAIERTLKSKADILELDKYVKADAVYTKDKIGELINSKAEKTEIKNLSALVEVQKSEIGNKVDKNVLNEYIKAAEVYTKKDIQKWVKHYWIAYGITTATLVAGLIASFLI